MRITISGESWLRLAAPWREFVPNGDKVLGVANEFLIRGWEADEPLTHMQLQKLCYMAHGFTLALLDRPLTVEEIEAWDFGPVYPELYDALKAFGNEPITSLIHENNWAMAPHVRGDVVRVDLPKKKTAILKTVWDDYGEYDAFQLSALTHEEGTPWQRIYRPGRRHLKIPDNLIKEYFVGLTAG